MVFFVLASRMANDRIRRLPVSGCAGKDQAT
jgi:hypothetical protein